MRFKILPNGIQKLVQDKSKNVWETEYGIRFKMLWNGICNPFHKKNCTFLKRNTEAVSKRYETDSVIRFIKKIAIFFMKRITESVS